ncbi:hypothetical protein [Pseudomonas viridiflava]|uniref:hypothetical protein n=2 Tax=Pseudomonas viridiflava TaxID=33069 RepID=UPI0012DD2BE4|nr:hypothetical protein [Pseudomonas viridiflava]
MNQEPMAQRIRSIIVVCALLLAVMTAWTTHVSTSLIGNDQAATGSALEAAHTRDSHHDDHAHTPLIGDHQHEIPNLGVVPAIKDHFAGSCALIELRYPLPNAPVFQIKRPPRPQLVI